MTSPPPPSLQTLRNRRVRAENWISAASWTAMGSAAVASLVVIGFAVSDTSLIADLLPLFAALVAQALVGYKLREHSEWAAWGLMATYIASFAASLLVYGVWSGILFKAGIAYVYVRGWLATIDYNELSKRIAAASSSPSAVGDAT